MPDRETPTIVDDNPRRSYKNYVNHGENTQDKAEAHAIPHPDMWNFQESESDGNNGTQRLDIWILQGDCRSHHSTGARAGFVAMVFRYFHDEFFNVAWPQAVKKFADTLGLDSYTHEYLDECYKRVYERKGDIDMIAEWKQFVLEKWPKPMTNKLVDKLADAYGRKGDIDKEIAGWKQLVWEKPLADELVDKLADAYERKGDIHMEIAGWKQLVNSNPNILKLHDELARTYERQGDLRLTCLGWHNLVGNHPNNLALQGRLRSSYAIQCNPDEAVAGWLKLMEQHPFRRSIMMAFRDACYEKYGRALKDRFPTLPYFWLLCLLSILSAKAKEYGFTEIDWWPFASEDDLAIIWPYMVKVRYSSVQPDHTIFAQLKLTDSILVTSGLNTVQIRQLCPKMQPQRRLYFILELTRLHRLRVP